MEPAVKFLYADIRFIFKASEMKCFINTAPCLHFILHHYESAIKSGSTETEWNISAADLHL